MIDEQCCVGDLVSAVREIKEIAEQSSRNAIDAIDQVKQGRERMKAQLRSIAETREIPNELDAGRLALETTRKVMHEASRLEVRWQDALINAYDALISMEEFPVLRVDAARIAGIIQGLRSLDNNKDVRTRNVDIESFARDRIERRGLMIKELVAEVSALNDADVQTVAY